VPEIRPFRALRYEPETVGDLTSVVAPPYDVILPAEREALIRRNPKNVVRLDLPSDEQGDEPGDKYRRAARTLAAWRSDGTFRKDPRPSIYVYEETYRVPGSDVERVQRGFFARLRLEPFGPESTVLPHERTLAGPKEDRYMLLRATGVNTSPVVGLYDDPSGRARQLLAEVAATSPVLDVRDDDGVRHRLWPVAAGDGNDVRNPAVEELIRVASAGPITIADGHHRYETALRYRDERRMTRSCEEDPAFDYLLMLFLDTAEPLTVLPTHRVVRAAAAGSASAGGANGSAAGLLDRVRGLFDVTPASRDELEAAFGAAALSPGGRGRFGLWTRDGGAILTAKRPAFEPLLGSANASVRGLDVAMLQAALDSLLGIDAAAVAAGRIAYTKSAAEAISWVDASRDGAEAAFLLEPTPVADIGAVARSGAVMPQKSTYFYPKALSGLLINPLEW
jgi:uncharacterized protein (DUF1015 family)